MSASMQSTLQCERESPLLASSRCGPIFAYIGVRAVSTSAFLDDVANAAETLSPVPYALNLCEDRYRFLVGFCAAAVRGMTTLLPPSRAPDMVAETLTRFPDACALSDVVREGIGVPVHVIDADGTREVEHERGSIGVPQIAADVCVAIGFTSGSTGTPQQNRKTWGSFAGSSACNIAVLDRYRPADQMGQVIATVPPQHMYGMELSVLLPLLGSYAVHAVRPFFPADIAAALAQVPEPRFLVTTPVHLRALVESGIAQPAIAAIVVATAPLSLELARAAESALNAPVVEMFGSTETCVIAHREPVRTQRFTLYPGVHMQAGKEVTLVDAPWFSRPTALQDVVERDGADGFHLRGRSTDLVEIAGKRASLGEISQRILSLPGVVDAVVLQSERADAAGVRRICALVVAPGRTGAEISAALKPLLDPVFLPRPLRCVDTLPRNETGKLSRAALLELLES